MLNIFAKSKVQSEDSFKKRAASYFCLIKRSERMLQIVMTGLLNALRQNQKTAAVQSNLLAELVNRLAQN